MKFINLKTASVLIAVRASAQDTQENIAAGTGKASALEIDAAANTDLITEIESTGGDETDGRRLMEKNENNDDIRIPFVETKYQTDDEKIKVWEDQQTKLNDERKAKKNELKNLAKGFLGGFDKNDLGGIYRNAINGQDAYKEKVRKDAVEAQKKAIEEERERAEKQRAADAALDKRMKNFQWVLSEQDQARKKLWEEFSNEHADDLKKPDYDHETAFDNFRLGRARKDMKEREWRTFPKTSADFAAGGEESTILIRMLSNPNKLVTEEEGKQYWNSFSQKLSQRDPLRNMQHGFFDRFRKTRAGEQATAASVEL